MTKRVDILGIKFDYTTKAGIVRKLEDHIQASQKAFVVTANPEIVMYAQRHAAYRETLHTADYIVADGIGVIMAAKLLNEPLPERIPGFELMKDLLQVADEKKLKVFFLGAKENVLEKTVENVKRDYPHLEVCGSHHGFFKENDPTVLAQIQQTKPDIVFVALGYPRQENWISTHLAQLDKGIFMGVGGSFDVLAGTVKRAPDIWIRLNLEWLYRLLKQPSRWKRMAFLPLFIRKVIKAKKQNAS